MFVRSLFLFLLAIVAPASAAETRCSLWIDLCDAEPVRYEDVLSDLSTARVVYVGERHGLERHHAIQAQLIDDLGRRGVKLVLALEQLEAHQQTHLDRYARGEVDFEKLAELTAWEKHWRGHVQYKQALEAARRHKSPIIALNARAETIRQIARSGGVGKLEKKLRDELPAEMALSDPSYEKLLRLQMPVHAAATADRLQPMIEAQIARDEAMAARLVEFLASEAGRGRTAIVLCGASHAAYGLGMPARVRRHVPSVQDWIVLLSESGEVELSENELAQARPIRITHQQLRELGRVPGDYLYATEPGR